ncbi:MAG: FGGY-family carbohydrate kinase [Rhizobiaceae bacterium]
MSDAFLCAVDVGTGSARAGIFDRAGRLYGRAEHPIFVHQPLPDHAEHDSEDIWRAVCHAVRGALAKADVDGAAVKGIGFDATCSLVVRGEGGRPLGISTTDEQHWDTISWFDHRALAEADECTATGHEVLTYIGGVMSPEMETPKLMWLKRHRPGAWEQARHFFDLADFLTWKASASEARSQNTLTAKWTHLPHAGGWRRDFFETLGVGDLLERGGLPYTVTPVGARVGNLTETAATELGLTTDCAVASGLIDAFAGMLGVVGAHAGGEADRHLALIAGTSSCVMAFSNEPKFVPSIWGPYFGAALPECWLTEGGQSATGALLDHVIRWHAKGGEPTPARHGEIVGRVQALRAADPTFGHDLHVLPDFHGNRSPLAEPHARGVISGLSLDSSFDSLCKLYWRTCVGIALGVRHILDHMNEHGYRLDKLHVTGGHTKNPLLMELYADATGATVVESETEDAVLLGSAMLAASAAGWHPDLATACRAMHQKERVRKPDAAKSYERDYRIFLAMHRHQREILGL